jgi:TonB family protein
MSPLLKRPRGLSKKLGVAFFSFALVLQAGAFQSQNQNQDQKQVQIEAKEAGRKIKNRIPPKYPELAIKTKLVGMARIEMTVMPDGSVSEVKELGGNPLLLGALVSAVKQWKYEPASRESVMEIKAFFQ